MGCARARAILAMAALCARLQWLPPRIFLSRAGCPRSPGTTRGSRSRSLCRGRGRGRSRARSHCRFVLPLIQLIPEPLTYSVPLVLKRQCDRTLGRRPAKDQAPASSGPGSRGRGRGRRGGRPWGRPCPGGGRSGRSSPVRGRGSLHARGRRPADLSFWSAACLTWSIAIRAHAPRQTPTAHEVLAAWLNSLVVQARGRWGSTSSRRCRTLRTQASSPGRVCY